MPNSPQTFPVYVFNTTNAQFTMAVNQGAAFLVPPTSGPAYTPATPSTEPQFVLGPYASQGSFALIQNTVVVNLPRASGPQTVTVDLNNSNVPAEVFSMQMYFFFETPSTLRWLFLVNGSPSSNSGTLTMPAA
jgi:hypothetical protein